MTHNISKQHLSDLIDNQLDADDVNRVVSGVGSDPDLRTGWRNYHLIGDVIRGEINQTGNCLVDRVSASLEKEITLLAPVSKAEAKEEVKPPQLSKWNNGGLYAVAASAALVAILVFSTPNQSSSPGIASTNNADAIDSSEQVLAAAGDQGEVNPVDASSVASDNALVKAKKDFQAEFGQMLVEHGEFTAMSGLNGLVAYAKLVSKDSLE